MKKLLPYQRNAYILSLCLLLLVAACAAVICMRQQAAASGARVADIYQEGRLIHSIPLHEGNGGYTLTVAAAGGSNVIAVRSGRIGVIQADCPDRLCVHQGFISTSLLPVTCLPHRLVIRIRSLEDGEPDTVAY
ncbi:MAG: NusG domain II-containing protein [Clostridium sp.]|jgi:hypothetical protein|nr:NusG domain II-containing protein [Clostridium sp.]